MGKTRPTPRRVAAQKPRHQRRSAFRSPRRGWISPDMLGNVKPNQDKAVEPALYGETRYERRGTLRCGLMCLLHSNCQEWIVTLTLGVAALCFRLHPFLLAPLTLRLWDLPPLHSCFSPVFRFLGDLPSYPFLQFTMFWAALLLLFSSNVVAERHDADLMSFVTVGLNTALFYRVSS